MLGSFGSDCVTGLLELLLVELLFELFPLVLVLFLWETDTPTPTPMAMRATRATRPPMSCGDGMSQSGYSARDLQAKLGKAPRVSPTTDPLLFGANKTKELRERTYEELRLATTGLLLLQPLRRLGSIESSVLAIVPVVCHA